MLLRIIIPIDKVGISSKLATVAIVRIEIASPRAELVREAGRTKIGVADGEALIEAVDDAAGAQGVGSGYGLAAADTDRRSG